MWVGGGEGRNEEKRKRGTQMDRDRDQKGGGGIDEERDGMEAAHSLKNTGAGMEKEIKRDIA